MTDEVHDSPVIDIARPVRDVHRALRLAKLRHESLFGADPDVTLQVGADTFPARARTASPDEKPRLWKLVLADLPMYEGFQHKTNRDIPVVILERVR